MLILKMELSYWRETALLLAGFSSTLIPTPAQIGRIILRSHPTLLHRPTQLHNGRHRDQDVSDKNRRRDPFSSRFQCPKFSEFSREKMPVSSDCEFIDYLDLASLSPFSPFPPLPRYSRRAIASRSTGAALLTALIRSEVKLILWKSCNCSGFF